MTCLHNAERALYLEVTTTSSGRLIWYIFSVGEHFSLALLGEIPLWRLHLVTYKVSKG